MFDIVLEWSYAEWLALALTNTLARISHNDPSVSVR